MRDGQPDRVRRVGVIGGGPAGALCARTLNGQVGSVVVFDKGRGPGGRLSTRRYGTSRFDHGAQYMTIRHPSISPLSQQWSDAGIIAPWAGLESDLHGSDPLPREPRSRRFVGVPGMSSLVGLLMQGLDVRFNTEVTAIRRMDDRIRVSFTSAMDEVFDIVVLAVPSPQAAVLLADWPDLEKAISDVRYHPCWATMMELPQAVDVPWTAARTSDPRIRWMARNNTKPGRPAAEAWVLHASPEWTRNHIDDSDERVGRLMSEGFREILGISEPETLLRAHRWLYAQVYQPVGREYLLGDGIGICGDGLLGGRIENALVSGLSLANRILSTG